MKVRPDSVRRGMPSLTAADRLDAALAGARRGWSVLALRPRAKAPLVPWLELQGRRAGENEIRGWFARWPDANVGVVTGAVSGLVVLDVDPRHGGRESLAVLEAGNGALPATVEAVTGGGGRHYYFAHPGGAVPNRAGVEPGIDVRGDGGSIVMPPSLHPSGKRYRWVKGHAPDELSPAALPQWLLATFLERPRAGGHSVSHWRNLLREGVEEGARNDTVASLAGHLLWRGVDPYVTLELMLCWNRVRCRPPLPDDEVSRTVASITRLHLRVQERPYTSGKDRQ